MFEKPNRKEIINAYKKLPTKGGVFKIVNKVNGRYYLGCTPNLTGMLNRFTFAQSTGSCSWGPIEDDWKSYGGAAFSFEVLEEIEKKEDQTAAEFKEDLQALCEMLAEEQDKTKAY